MQALSNLIELIISAPVISAVSALAAIAIIFGLILGFAAVRFKVDGDPIVETLDSILPQTQCGQCGYPGCKPYAEAIAEGDDINKCPPGGQSTVNQIAEIMGVEAPELDAPDGDTSDDRIVAVIREDECIGCTKCIQACPVDAILGAAKQMHTVIESECTGCDLCVDPCPVDCIDMVTVEENVNTWLWQKPTLIATDLRGEIET